MQSEIYEQQGRLLTLEVRPDGRLAAVRVRCLYLDDTFVVDTIDLTCALKREQLAKALSSEKQRDDLRPMLLQAASWWMGRKSKNRNAPPARQTQSSKAAAGSSRATDLIALVGDLELFRSRDHAHVTIRVDKHSETHRLRGRAFRQWLRRVWFTETKQALAGQVIDDAIDLLEARAMYEGDERDTHVRLAGLGENVYLDLGNEQWGAVEISPSGWRMVGEAPVKFLRSPRSHTLPTPRPGGNLNELRNFVNLDGDDDFILLVTWLLAALRPHGPYPILAIHGEQGSAKSTTSKVLKGLVDPAAAPLRGMPRSEHDLMISATKSWILVYDNISKLQVCLSDVLCRLSTGGGFATRELYTDDVEVVFEAQRPVILNGIEDLAERGDLLDRSIVLTLPRIPDTARMDEAEFWSSFLEAKPRILGALLSTLSAGLKALPHQRLADKPRMADFAKWGAAIAAATDWSSEDFHRAYAENRTGAHRLALDASILAQPLLALLEEQTEWIGSATELLAKLDVVAGDREAKRPGWPRTAASLSGQLRRMAPNLRASGIAAEFPSRKARKRLIRITSVSQLAELPSPASPASQDTNGTNQECGDAPGGTLENDVDDGNDAFTADLREDGEGDSTAEGLDPW